MIVYFVKQLLDRYIDPRKADLTLIKQVFNLYRTKCNKKLTLNMV